MVVNITLAAVSCTAGVVPTLTTSNIPQALTGYNAWGSAAVASNKLTAVAALTAGAGYAVKYSAEYVDFQGTRLAFGAARTNYIRYCEYPGQRVFKKVKFEVNSNPLDEYDSNAMVFHQKFKILPHKATGWKRLVGQEVPRDAYSDFGAVSGTSRYQSSFVGLTDASTAAAIPSAPVNASNTARKIVQVVDGPQTAKASQPALDLWVPFICQRCRG